jgi:hypothetical protein
MALEPLLTLAALVVSYLTRPADRRTQQAESGRKIIPSVETRQESASMGVAP